MNDKIFGLHHITGIAGDPNKNHAFYTKVLGLRFVKKSVNFDAPRTYHFYFGDDRGRPGTVLTFFPWGARAGQGHRGSGMATEVAFSVPDDSLGYWTERFKELNVIYNKPSERLGEEYLPFVDHDGLKMELVAARQPDERKGWESGGIDPKAIIKGFHGVTLTLNEAGPTAKILTEIFGYKKTLEEVNRSRYVTEAAPTANIVDIVEIPSEKRGHVANGTIHHVAFAVKTLDDLKEMREKLRSFGLQMTEVIDRQYFKSIYFRTPGGVLFELATEAPGLEINETYETLGTGLMLPPQFESMRKELELTLPLIQ